ncbi:MAG TPA: NUDIX domain-containing protein [Synechococcales cyanobacterium M55_K2018_004]|nr:NUDIX domain-containing protein [Synechococcales cyanobacterium M55_K2018_004]
MPVPQPFIPSSMKDEAFGIIPILKQGDDCQFLLVQHHAGHWGFPKGHADPGETAIAAACREFEEETGITAYTPLTQFSFSEQYTFIRNAQTIQKTVVYFPAWVQTTEVTCQAKEIQAFAWLPYEAALKRLTFTPAKQVLTEVQKSLQQLPPPETSR